MSKKRITILQDPRYSEFCLRYWNDFPRYVCENSSKQPSWQQMEVFEAMTVPGCDVAIASGHGCFGKGTGIMLFDGTTKAVEDVVVGDQLMGDDGTPRNVLALWRGKENLYRFTYMDKTSHVFNESHTLCLVATNSKGLRKAGDKIEVTVKEWLTWGEDKKRCHAAYRVPVQEFGRPDQELPIPPYIFGLWLGDGHSHEGTLTTPDPEILSAWYKYAKKIGYTVTNHGVRGTAHTWHLCGEKGKPNHFKEELRDLGVFRNKHIPEAYLFAGFKDRLELLAGILDTDGYFDRNSGGFEISQKSEVLARQIVTLAKSVGCHATVRESRKECCNNGKWGTYWRVTIGRNVQQIPARVERKKPTPLVRKGRSLNFGIKKCDFLGEDDYYGFDLDGNSRFLSSDFTVLRNTGKSWALAWFFDWHLRVFPLSNALLTANNLEQCRIGVWKYLDEVIADVENNWPWQRGHFIKMAKRYYSRDFKDSWFVMPKTASKHKPEGMAGQHALHYAVVVDEASGVEDVIHDVIEGALTQAENRHILVSQPTRSVGRFADAFTTLKDIYKTFQLNAEESPFVDRPWIEKQLIKYGGHHSPEYQIKVLGRFPDNLEGFLLPRIWLEEAQSEQIEHVEQWGWVITADVAEGVFRDSSVWSIGKVSGYGPERKVEITESREFLGLNELDFARELYQRILDFPNITVAIDADGPGRTVILTLEELGVSCERIHWGLPPHADTDRKRYKNLRAFASMKCREAIFGRRMSLPVNKKMVEQGAKIPYKIDEAGRYQIMPKDQMKSQGIKSPDLFDTACFFFLVDYVPFETERAKDTDEVVAWAKAILDGE